MYKPFSKEECWNCGKRFSNRQKHCPYCKTENPDYKPKHQIGSATKAVKEDEEENKESAGAPVELA